MESLSSSAIARRLGLRNLAVHRIPDSNITATVQQLVQEQYDLLKRDPSAQDTVIFYGATRVHVTAIITAKYPARMTYFGEDRGGLPLL